MITTINNKHKKLNVPNLRFPEFQGEWEKCKVSDLLDFYSTNSLSWDKLEYGTDAIQNLHYGLIHVGLPTMIDLSKDKLPNITNGTPPKTMSFVKKVILLLLMPQKIQTRSLKLLSSINLTVKM